LHHGSFREDLGSVVTQQKSVALQQNNSAQELAKVALLHKITFRQPERSSRLPSKGVLQQNKAAEYLGRDVLLHRNDVLQQNNAAGLQDGLF
jgi:hypothetical protein